MRYREEFAARSCCRRSRRLTRCLAVALLLCVAASFADAATALTVAPTGLSFAVAEGESNPPAQSLTIITPGARGVSWFATSSASWLQVIPLAGTTPASLFVTANVTGLTPGTYTGTILVTARQTGASQVVSVSLTVTPQSAQSQ